MVDSAAPPAKEPKVDHPQPADEPPAPTSPSSLQGGAPDPDADHQPAEPDNSSDTEKQSKADSQRSTTSSRSAGVSLDDLATVINLFDDGSLQPCDDQDDVAHPHSAQLNGKVILWCVPSRLSLSLSATRRLRSLTPPPPTSSFAGAATSRCVSRYRRCRRSQLTQRSLFSPRAEAQGRLHRQRGQQEPARRWRRSVHSPSCSLDTNIVDSRSS